ncbi:MAG TPA: sensor histidine kinase [Micrococcaceae bacterium]|nr:sensor histidine kinase [Micrococcaceae bacterium]
MGLRDWSIARRLLVGNLLFILLATAIVTAALYFDARDRSYSQAEDRMASIATTIADNPLVLTAAASPDPTAALQPYAQQVMAGARVDFITIMAPDRTRWTHPNPAEIGKPYIGSIEQALAGRTYTEITAGTLGPSVRAIVPVKDASGAVKALVAVGVTVTNVEVALSARLPAVVGIALLLLLGGSIAAWLLGRYLRRVTLGWGPERLGQLFAYYESVLHSVRDGLVLVDRNGELVMYNDQAAELLGIGAPVEGRPAPKLSELELPESLEELLRSGRTARDEIHLTGSRLLVVSQEPARSPGAAPVGAPPEVHTPSKAAVAGTEAKTSPAARFRRPRPSRMGTVATLQDHTVIQRLGDELRSTRTLTDALRAQTHEHANRIHTLVSLLELGRTEQALQFATQDLQLSQRLADEVLSSVDEPVISALLMGKAAQANERGIELRVRVDADAQTAGISAHDAVTILGNLIDNALDAAADGEEPRWVEVNLGAGAGVGSGRGLGSGSGGRSGSGTDLAPGSGTGSGTALILEVADSGVGVDATADNVLKKGFTTKLSDGGGRGIGLALVRQSVQRLGGSLDIGRRAGAVFTVTLPVGPANGAGDLTTSEGPAGRDGVGATDGP